MCTHRGGLSAGGAGAAGAGAGAATATAAGQQTTQQTPAQQAQQAAPRRRAANRTTNAQQAVRNANWSNSAGSGRLNVPGVGRVVALEVSNPVLGDRVSVDVYDQSGALVNTRYFSGRMMSSRARQWGRDELDRIARQLP